MGKEGSQACHECDTRMKAWTFADPTPNIAIQVHFQLESILSRLQKTIVTGAEAGCDINKYTT
jgi:hypothetical protein